MSAVVTNSSSKEEMPPKNGAAAPPRSNRNRKKSMVLITTLLLLVASLLLGLVFKFCGNRQQDDRPVESDATGSSSSLQATSSLALSSSARSTTLSCEPSYGICASNLDELGRLNAALQTGETLAVCGSIQMEDALVVTTANVTFCCAEGSRCSLQSGGSRNLIIRAPDVTLRGLSFERGITADGDGGNVLVNAPGGHFQVANCAFLDGSADNGGNLHVQDADTVLITNSRFEFGRAENGAGVSIKNTPNVSIYGSFFDFNRCGNQGGGLRVYSSAPTSMESVSVTISRTRFSANGAGRGAGFYLRNLGEYLRLRIDDSYFGENGAAVQGGVGFIFHNEATSLNAVLSGNIEEDNMAINAPCVGLFFDPLPNSPSGSDCRSIDDLVVYLPEGETLAPTGPPTAAPIVAPPTSPPSPTCTPSIGFCADSYPVLARMAETLAPRDTIAICGTILLEETITISEPDVTLCCADSSRCILQSDGNGRNLVWTGANPTIQGLVFEGGASVDGNGGNVFLDARGEVEISHSAFTDGNAVYGGNLHIQNADSVVISNSRFELGTADFGGGVSVRDTRNVSIAESYFDSNRCGSQGGGIIVYSTSRFSDMDHSVSMSANRFTSNGADRGGAFFLRTLGNFLRLRMTDSYFGDNAAAVQGGEGFLLQNSTVDVLFTNNIGEDNVVVRGDCSGVFFRPFPNTISGSDCRTVNEDISY